MVSMIHIRVLKYLKNIKKIESLKGVSSGATGKVQLLPRLSYKGLTFESCTRINFLGGLIVIVQKSGHNNDISD